REVDVLNSQTTALEQAQAGAIEQRRHEPLCAVELADDGAHLVAAADPADVRLLGAATAVAKADGLAYAVEELGRAGTRFAHEKVRVRRSGITEDAVNSGCHG